jgi:hypothetical protein
MMWVVMKSEQQVQQRKQDRIDKLKFVNEVAKCLKIYTLGMFWLWRINNI